MSRLVLSTLCFILTMSAAVGFMSCAGGGPPYGTPLYIEEGDNPFDQPARFITSIYVEPAGVNLAIGGSQQFRALATWNDGVQDNISSSVEWYAENPGVGIFSTTLGRYLAQNPGVAVIRCRVKQTGTEIVSSAAFVNSFNPNQSIPPAIPRNPSLTSSGEGVLLNWDINVEDGDLAGYNILRTQTYGAHYASDFGKVNPYAPVLYPPFLDQTVVSGWYYYRITAQDLLGVNSAPSDEISVFVTASSHYGTGYDAGTSPQEAENYQDLFSTAY